MTYAPRPFTKPKARNPAEAADLYQYKLDKRWPFIMRGYDNADDCDFRKYGLNIRPDNKPIVRGISYDTACFFLHSQYMFLGERMYTFIHLIHLHGSVIFRPLMFDNFSDAYRYAYAHGCKITKKQTIEIDVVDFLTDESCDDNDMFVETVELTYYNNLNPMEVSASIKNHVHKRQTAKKRE